MKKNVWKSTLIVFISDHGLHYGPYFQSSEGLKERAQPMLHFHLPMTKINKLQKAAIEQNSNLLTTPFDVYETILHTLMGKKYRNQKSSYGTSLLENLPLPDRLTCHGTELIPSRFCEIIESVNVISKENILIQSASRFLNTPSLYSFFADLPNDSENWKLWREKCHNEDTLQNFNLPCKCLTSHQVELSLCEKWIYSKLSSNSRKH